ncbi:MAG TPA: hypothetical protein VE959_12265 [Bryobacteraceae bacterium]|nr:hypothetical protein [Bryobacteraceae bacterium]
MFYGRACAFSTLAAAAVLALPADGQSVISTHSGVVHFFQGAVYLGGEPLEPRLGKFPSMTEGAELRTAEGRAEVLLTPGVFLRLGERAAIRMMANDLSDTRVEMLAGSAIVDSSDPSSLPSVTLIYKEWKMQFPQRGIYRFDVEPPRLWVQQGEAEVSAAGSTAPVSVEQGMYLPIGPVLAPERSIDVVADTLTEWARGRGESISADNAITAQIDEDPASANSLAGLDGLTSFPLIGASYLGLGSYGLYNSATPYQLGFNSIYLPGFTYRPLLLGLPPGGVRSYLHPLPFPRPAGGPSGFGTSTPVPRAPLPRPAPAHPIPHGPVHVGVHH